ELLQRRVKKANLTIKRLQKENKNLKRKVGRLTANPQQQQKPQHKVSKARLPYSVSNNSHIVVDEKGIVHQYMCRKAGVLFQFP
ncbi:unnamed protein product, partial [Prorocentrum cordatum]